MCSSMGRSSNRTAENSSCKNDISLPRIPLSVSVPWAMAYSIVALLVLFGNSLVVLSFVKMKRLRTRTNYFIASLSVTDSFVGAISLPWWIYLTFASSQGQSWYMLLHEIWIIFDILGGVGSILHLVALSWDRLCAVAWPLLHRTYSRRRYICILCFIWACAILVAGCSPYGRTHAQMEYNVSVVIVFFFVPLLGICVAQVVIFFKIRQSSLRTFRRSLRVERRVTKTISVMVGLFIVGWLPFFTLSLLAFTSPNLALIPWQAVYIVKFLQYSNSAVNPVLYASNFPHFKKGYTAVLCPCREVSKSARTLAVSFRRSLNSTTSNLQQKRRTVRKCVRRKSPGQETSGGNSNKIESIYPSATAVVQVEIELQQSTATALHNQTLFPNHC